MVYLVSYTYSAWALSFFLGVRFCKDPNCKMSVGQGSTLFLFIHLPTAEPRGRKKSRTMNDDTICKLIKYGLLIFVFLIIIPLALNFVLLRETPLNLCVVGGPQEWLVFFGSYFGGSLTAIIGVITLRHTERKNKLRIEIEYRRTQLHILEKTLADCVSSYDFTRISNIALIIKDKNLYNSYFFELNEHISTLIRKANSFGLIYGTEDSVKYTNPRVQFRNKYIDCHNEFVELASKLQQKMNQLRFEEDEISELSDEICGITQSFDCFKENHLKPLFRLAQEWIRHEQKEIKDLENEL